MTGALARFPTRPRVLSRLGLSSGDRQTALDAEMRRVEAAIAALKKRKAILLAEYRTEIRRQR